MKSEFDYSIADSQGSEVKLIEPQEFDIGAYHDYAVSLRQRCSNFWNSKSGIAVYRRFRVPQVFSYGCNDMKLSLALQLGALRESMKYTADIPNFLEPWYGIGTVASAFGVDYEWPDGQAPAIRPPFKSVQEALNCNLRPIEETAIGKNTLSMIEYFIEKTKGMIPISLTDTQSPLNTASLIIDNNSLFMSFFDCPGDLKKLLQVITDLLIGFTEKQIELIGESLVYPGHGFASSTVFTGLGMSDDVMLMLSENQFVEFELEILSRAGQPFGGVAFHSCGNWSPKAEAVKKIIGLIMADGAFTSQTDPNPNMPELISDNFAGTNIIINARMVGSEEVVLEKVSQLYKPGTKLIAVTYCKTPHEQKNLYEKIHALT
jgi:hypothetical protein